MAKREWTLLFNEYDLRSVLENQRAKTGEKVRAIPPADFDVTSDEFLTARVASELVVAPVILLEEDVEISTRDAKIDVSHDFNRATNPYGPTFVDGVEVTYHLPFTGDAELLQCRPSAFTTNGARAVIGTKELKFPYDCPDRDVLATKTAFLHDLGKLKLWLGWVDEQVNEYNAKLEPEVRRRVAERRAELQKTQADVELLGFNVRGSPSATAVPPPTEAQIKRERIARRERGRRKYDVALSFAGEDRQYVEAVAQALVDLGVTVFYDGFEKAELWGKDLAEHLAHVYGQDARYTVIFASRHYAAKAWPNHEKSFAIGRHLKGETGRILPARFDDTEIPGLSSTLGYLDLRVLSPPQLAELLRQKIDLGELDA